MRRLVCGAHPVTEAIGKPNVAIEQVLLARQPRTRAIAELAERRGIPVNFVDASVLDGMTPGVHSHQGAIAILGAYPYVTMDDLLEARPDGAPPLLVAADCVMDPQNLGSIFRSALVLGATGLVIPSKRAAQVTPTVVRVSAGATEHLRCAQVTNMARALEQAKQAGLWVAATVQQGGQHPSAVDLTVPLVVVVGNEGSGVRPLVERGCDLKLTLPQASAIASLNVAAATAVFLYEVSRQRYIAGHSPRQRFIAGRSPAKPTCS